VISFENPPPRSVFSPRITRPTSKDVEMTGGETKSLLSSGKRMGPILEYDSTPPIWKNIPVVTTLVIYFLLKFALECSVSSAATLTAFFFGWGAQPCGVYLAVLGLLMFPANMLVAYFSRQYDDRELIVATMVMLFMGICGSIHYKFAGPYSLCQYIVAGVLIFISTNAMEAPNMSLLSKTIPKSWAKGIFNVGLLATEAGTLGRAVGDVFITWCGLNGVQDLLNNMMISLLLLLAVTLSGVYQVYPYLEPFEKDD
jgi:hypothetical protein